MSAKKEVYLLVKSLVEAIPEIKHWDYWNDNVQRDGTVDSFPTPAVFFEYTGAVWEQSSSGSTQNIDDKVPNQKGELSFALHIVIKKSETEDKDEIRHFDIEDLVYKAVHFKSFETNDFIEGKIQRSSEDAVLRHNVWRDMPINYTATVLECGNSGVDDGSLVDAQPVDFETEVELSIKNKLNQNPGTLIINISE